MFKLEDVKRGIEAVQVIFTARDAVRDYIEDYLKEEINDRITKSTRMAIIQVVSVAIIALVCAITLPYEYASGIILIVTTGIFIYNTTLFFVKTLPAILRYRKYLRGWRGFIMKRVLGIYVKDVFFSYGVMPNIAMFITVLIVRSVLVVSLKVA